MQRILLICMLFFAMKTSLFAQNDTIKLSNNDVLIGEFIRMGKSVLTFSTPYSDSDFLIKWSEVKEFYSPRIFIVSLNSGERFTTTIDSDRSNSKQVILYEKGTKRTVNNLDIIHIETYGTKFFSRIDASFDIGVNFTKATNLKQITANTLLEYIVSKWNYKIFFNGVFNRQDNTENINRYNSNFSVQRYLPKDWFLQGTVDFLSNNDQNLKLRSFGGIGPGYFIKNNYRMFLSIGAGLAYNNELFFSDFAPDKSSLESYFEVRFNEYGLGKFSIQSNFLFLPSLTESKRIRLTYKLDLVYDITSRVYIKTGFNYSYDNQPFGLTPKDDYVFQTTLGWDND